MKWNHKVQNSFTMANTNMENYGWLNVMFMKGNEVDEK